METSTALNLSVQSELTRRHKTTATTVVWLLIAVILLCVLAFVSRKFLTLRVSPPLDIAVCEHAVAGYRCAPGLIWPSDYSAKDDDAGGNDWHPNSSLRICCHARNRHIHLHIPSRSGCRSCPSVWLSGSLLLGTGRQALRTRKQPRSDPKRKLALFHLTLPSDQRKLIQMRQRLLRILMSHSQPLRICEMC